MPSEREPRPNTPVPEDTAEKVGDGIKLSRLVVSSPVDAIAVAAYLVGFHPSLSLVVVGISDQEGVMVMRRDLTPAHQVADVDASDLSSAEGAESVDECLMSMLKRNEMSAVLLLGYGPEELVTPAMNSVSQAAEQAELPVWVALRIDQGRWWSYTCQDPACCPPEGTAYDISTSVIAAQATLAGQVVLHNRDELIDSVAPLQGPARTAMHQATQRAEQRMCEQMTANGSATDNAAQVVDEGRRFIAELADRVRDGRARLTDDEAAWLGLLLLSLRLRDEAWVRIDVDHLHQHIAFWRDMTRRVQEPYAAAPASLLAYAAFASGDGGLANVALDRAEAADPAYTMAHLLRDVIVAGIPPKHVRLNITPEELATGYAEQKLTQGHDGSNSPS
ncbi:uncharacterized protein DUF4192 [Actinomadura pelletieri DSM 43383]|uniref:Uncharacterized protein DUF4192 n=1 Tax=Actinomadura pelletieri DSM 43383 TaxID=1120940 RepID=A0A495QX39_9ACTN|nr:uncharacterized protein DUF4192 [Actinomadura pelletieri DSM 43383]